MSNNSELINHATSVDWNLVAAAAATFIGTLIVTIWGWFTGRKKLQEKLSQASPIIDAQVTSAVLLDNLTIREATLVNREVRDQLLLHTHALVQQCKATEDNTAIGEDILEELKKIRRGLKDQG